MRYVCLFLFFASAAWPNRVGTVRGELSCDSCNLGEFYVELQDAVRNLPSERIPVGASGDFELRSVAEGQYLLQISSSHREEVYREHISITNSLGPIRIRIPEPKQERPATGVISVARLLHKVPKSARREYEKAQQAYERKEIEVSLQHLRKAVEIDPEFMQALNNLGSRLIMLKRTEEAVAAFRRALELDPSQSLVHSNLAVALMQLRQYRAAELEARAALTGDRSDAKARYVLGLSLYAQRQFTAETVSALEKSEAQFPSVRPALDSIKWVRGYR